MSTDKLAELITQINKILLGKDRQVRLALSSILAKGHLLIEDLPGVGKTTLAHLLARGLGLEFNRVQFTSDLLPADILGVSIYDRHQQQFNFHKGPIFAQMLLTDEINRASPKCQSALLEAMEEHQVSIEGETYPLPEPFFVIATQNPSEQIGTFPLPESQLDRFLMVLSLGYPDLQAERELLLGNDRREQALSLQPILNGMELSVLQQQVSNIEVSKALVEYLLKIVDFSRHSPLYLNGLSPRAGLGILQASRAWAFIHGRDYVRPDDLQQVLPSLIGHRLQLAAGGEQHTANVVAPLLEIPIP